MMRLLFIVATGSTAIGLVLSGGAVSASAAPVSAAPVQKIVYADRNGGIWLVKANGAGRHEVSTVSAGSVSFAPNERTIAYTSAGGIWTVPVTGGAPRHVSVGKSVDDVAWSPNGTWLAYTAESSTGTSDIYRVPAGGGPVQRLTFTGGDGCGDSGLAWSPDSRSIAYVGAAGGAPSCGLVVQRIGQPGRIVVPDPELVTGSFTPTGNLVYVAPCEDLGVCGDVTVTYEANADGSNRTLIDGVEDSCRDGDLCQQGVIGAARGRGWVQELDVNPVEVGFSETCFQGGYQKGGTVAKTSPSFCLMNAQATGYDVA